MRSTTADRQRADAVARAVLHEGLVLYPYRSTAAKNRLRFSFGVVVPPAARDMLSERSTLGAQCVAEVRHGSTVDVSVRFLRLRHRSVETRVEGNDGVVSYEPVEQLQVGGDLHVSWDEVVEDEVVVRVRSGAEPVTVTVPFGRPGDEQVDELTAPAGPDTVRTGPDGTGSDGGACPGRIVRRLLPVVGEVTVEVEPDAGPLPLARIGVRINNTTEVPAAPVEDRAAVLRRSLVAAHALVVVDGGRVLSAASPPAFAAAAVRACAGEGWWPALVGGTEAAPVVLMLPIVVGDDPQLAPGSPGESCDATEIDEMLALRVATLTDDERRHARATDNLSAAIVDRWEELSVADIARLHGAGASTAAPGVGPVPSTGQRLSSGRLPSAGDRVRLHPRRSADVQDIFLVGRTAVVEAVLEDVDGGTSLAVSLDDDPATDLHRWRGRFRYFGLDEVEPVGAARAQGTGP